MILLQTDEQAMQELQKSAKACPIVKPVKKDDEN